MIRRLFLLFGILFASYLPAHAALEPSDTLYLKAADFYLWEVKVRDLESIAEYPKNVFAGLAVAPLKEQEETVAPFVSAQMQEGINLAGIQAYLWKNIAPALASERSDVTIDLSSDGTVIFDGAALPGRTLNVEESAHIVARAISEGISHVTLSVTQQEPTVLVQSPELREKGIQKLLSVGYTNYLNSPANRIHNIKTGMARFNGHMVEPGGKLTFGEVLGPVDGSTGYKPELVIKGEQTVPEFGGGLCQISSSAYRAALKAGFPITRRQNHSYKVIYYWPEGLDATIYPPVVDLSFVNDSPGHLLIQTLTRGSEVYYLFYGTPNRRTTHLIGPFVHARSGGGVARHEVTPDLKPGEVKVLQKAVGGLRVSWYQDVRFGDEEKNATGKEGFLDHIYSNYGARGLYTQEGTSTPSVPVSEIGG